MVMNEAGIVVVRQSFNYAEQMRDPVESTGFIAIKGRSESKRKTKPMRKQKDCCMVLESLSLHDANFLGFLVSENLFFKRAFISMTFFIFACNLTQKSIADELKLVVPDNAKVLDLRELIQESEIYKNDKETYQAIVDCVLEEINDKRNENENRLEIEKIKLSQLEKELEIAKLHNQSGKGLPLQNENQLITTECNIESLIKSIKTLTIPVPLRAESFNLFFQSIEKAFKTKNVPEKLKPEILLNILGEKANNLMIYLRDEDLSDYNKLKAIVLKEFQPTPMNV
ncbi:DUF1758 domain-containing protein [Trichonephila clavipes]|nr:DUF1758 domain-containing protein [Trichonephila clavipes]